MSPKLKEKIRAKVSDPWSGTKLALILLIAAVIALVAMSLFIPTSVEMKPFFQTQTAVSALTATPILTPVAETPSPPVVNTTILIVLCALIVIFVLIALLREVAWFKHQDHA